MSALLHMIPGYSLYSAVDTIGSDEPFAIKARDAAMAAAFTSLHFLNATHHALKIQRSTLSSPVGLTRSWSRISSLVTSPKTPLVAAITAAAFLISQIPGSSPDSYRYDERMAMSERTFSAFQTRV